MAPRRPSSPAPERPVLTVETKRLCIQRFKKRIEDLETYMAPHNPVFGADIPNFTDITPRFQISEVIV